MILVDVLLATICFTSNSEQECHPALVGLNTPRGEFNLNVRITSDKGYGGDVLQFYETDTAVYAIHRVWLLNPRQRRGDRLKSSNVKDRQTITDGCINVHPDVYKTLIDCCSNDTLKIK